MDILAIHGSYHQKGNISKLVDLALEGAAAAGLTRQEKIALADREILFCDNCLICLSGACGDTLAYRCPLEDDMAEIIDLIDEADNLILASPVNVGTVTALFKRFAERCAAASNIMKIGEAAERLPSEVSGLPPKEKIPAQLLDLYVPLPRSARETTRKALIITSAMCPADMIDYKTLDRTVGVMEDVARLLGFSPDKGVIGGGVTITPVGKNNKAEQHAFDAGKNLGE